RHTRWPRDWSSDVCSSDLIHNMITRAQFLAKDRLLLVSIVTKDGDVIVNPTLHLFDLDRTGISRWHRRDIRNELRLVHGPSFFISKNGIFGEIFLPRSLIA